MTTLTFRADLDLAAALQRQAKDQNMSVSRLVREACRGRLGLEARELDRRRFNRFSAPILKNNQPKSIQGHG
jgi:hypothetical protein